MTEDFLTREEVSALVPARDQTAHKGTCGRVLILAGSSQMMGAAILCAKAAFRSGVGYVYLATGASYVSEIITEIPELIALPLTETSDGYSDKALIEMKGYIDEGAFTSVVIGPGLGLSESTQFFIKQITHYISDRGLAGVIDADAFSALEPDMFKRFPMNLYVLTPHPKEFERFSGITYNEASRVEFSETFAQDIQQVLVLKGHHTVISYAGTAVLNPTGNPGMATAGTGDVLSGLIAGFIAQGVMTCDAAYLGVYVHGLAGDMLKEKMGEHSIMASDLIEMIPSSMKGLQT